MAANELWSSFKQGWREGPVVFFAPLIAVWRLVSREMDVVMAELEAKEDVRGSRRASNSTQG